MIMKYTFYGTTYEIFGIQYFPKYSIKLSKNKNRNSYDSESMQVYFRKKESAWGTNRKSNFPLWSAKKVIEQQSSLFR